MGPSLQSSKRLIAPLLTLHLLLRMRLYPSLSTKSRMISILIN